MSESAYSKNDSLDRPPHFKRLLEERCWAGTKMGGVDYKLSRVSCVQIDAEALPILGYTFSICMHVPKMAAHANL